MNNERREVIEDAIRAPYPCDIGGHLQKLLREVLDELDLREKQIAIAHHMLCQISGELGTIGNELEGMKSDN